MSLANAIWAYFVLSRCPRCGLGLTTEKAGGRRRVKVDVDEWAERCTGLKRGAGPSAPFDCRFLNRVAARLADQPTLGPPK